MTSLIHITLACALTLPMTAVRAYENGQWPKALQLAQQTLQNHAAQTVDLGGLADLAPEHIARPGALVPDDETQALVDARLVEALSLARLGRAQQAFDKLQGLDDDGVDLGPGMVLYRLHLAQALGHCDDAQTLADTLPQSSQLVAEAWLSTALCRVQAQDLVGAQIALQNMADKQSPEGPVSQARALSGHIAERLGHPNEAALIYKDLIARLPWTRAAKSVASRVAYLRRHGVEITPITPLDTLPIAAHQRDTLQYDAARQTLHKLAAQARRTHRDDWLNKADLGVIELDIVDRDYNEGVKLARDILRRAPQKNVRAQALYLLADIQGRQGRIGEALATFDGAQAQGAGAPFAQLAALAAARLAFATAHTDVAQNHLDWLLSQAPVDFSVTLVRDDGVPMPVSSDAVIDGALWLRAWMLVQRHAPFALTQKALESVRPTGDFADAALFWQARLAEDNGDIDNARVFASALARRGPTSFYAMLSIHLLSRVDMCTAQSTKPSLAWARLKAPFAPVTPEQLRPLAQGQDTLTVQVLFEHGLVTETRRMLRALPMQDLSDADRIVAASLYRRLGQTTRAVNLTRHVVVDRTRLEPALVEIAFPRPFARLVQAAARQYHVPAPLIYAIMREESGFDANAESPRQAYGLMQLIAPTAQRLARGAHLRHVKERGLLSPEVSIRLGALYLAELLRHTHGNLVATVAAYQAGEGNVRRWLRGREMMQPEAFAEEIPYTSTRQYVRDVLSDYGVYRLLLGAAPEASMQLTPAVAAHNEQACLAPFGPSTPHS